MCIYIYGGCSKFFLLETAILSQKNFYFSQTFAISTKNFRGALCCIVSGNFCYETKAWQGKSACLSDHKNSFCGGCAFTCGVLPLSVLLAHLLRPVLTLPHRNYGLTCFLPLWKQDITSQQFRPPSFQEKAVFRQALSKLSPNFREKSPYINFIFLKIHVCSSHILLLSPNFRQKIIYFSKFSF